MKISEIIKKEIIHFAEGDTLVSSKYRTVFFQKGETIKAIKLPETNPIKNIFGLVRLFRRALRLDKCNVCLANGNLVIIRLGVVYFYDSGNDQLTETLKLRNCRNVLHQSINVTPEGYIYFGEYGNNGDRKSVPVYCSKDGGRSWEEIYTFPEGSIKHIHGCYYDRYTDKIWVCTGDFKGENWLLAADKNFETVKKYGDGQQKYRTCNLIFRKDEVHWLMDSQLEPSHHIIFNRKTETITIGQKLMGPIWYMKELGNDNYLAASTQEFGDGVLDDKVHLYHSTDLKEWKSIKQFEHDGLPKKYFKFGVIGFADGTQTPEEFYMFFEAVKNFDGLALKCSL
jgi:hypothetical protein